MSPFTNTPHTAALPRKAPMDATFSHIKAVFCDIDGTHHHEPAHGVPAHRGGELPPARARRALWPVPRARRPRDRDHVRALGHRRPGGRARRRWRRGHRYRAHGIKRAKLPRCRARPSRASASTWRTFRQRPSAPRDGVFYVPESNACVEHLSRVDGVPYQVVDFAEVPARAAAGDVYHGTRR